MGPTWLRVFATAATTGRPRADATATLATILAKLRTGRGWNRLPAGTTAHAHYRALVAAGAWAEVWGVVCGDAEDAGFTAEEVGRASAWLLAAGAITGDGWPKAPPEPPRARPEPEDEPTEPEARPRTAVAVRIPDGLWERLSPLLPAAPAPPEGRGRKGGRPAQDQRELLEVAVQKLRTGRAWHGKALAPQGSAAARLFQAMVDGGTWSAAWREILATPELALTGDERAGATYWQIKKEFLAGTATDYGMASRSRKTGPT